MIINIVQLTDHRGNPLKIFTVSRDCLDGGLIYFTHKNEKDVYAYAFVLVTLGWDYLREADFVRKSLQYDKF